MPWSVFSFFSGCGILDYAFEKNGYDIVFVNEYSQDFMYGYQYARRNTQNPKYGYANYSADLLFRRYRKTSFKIKLSNEKKDGKLIGFIGGPPCPDFSIAGKNAGADGENGRLTRVYFKLICKYQPDFFVFENVKGLINTAKHRRFYDEMKRKMQHQYYISDKLLNSLEYGVPQYRERIIMVGIKKDIIPADSIWIHNHELVFPWALERKYELKDLTRISWPQINPYCEDGIIPSPPNIPLELTVEYWFVKNHVLLHPNGNDIFKVRNGLAKMVSIPEGDTTRKSYKRLHRWRFSPTAAYGHNEVHLHPYKTRRLSVAETMAIQSLPSEFVLPPDLSLSAKFKMIGNGVPFLLARAIAKSLNQILESIVDGGSDHEDTH